MSFKYLVIFLAFFKNNPIVLKNALLSLSFKIHYFFKNKFIYNKKASFTIEKLLKIYKIYNIETNKKL